MAKSLKGFAYDNCFYTPLSFSVSLSVILILNLASASEYRPSTNDAQRYLALIEQQQQLHARNLQRQRNPIGSFKLGGPSRPFTVQDNQNSDGSEGSDSYEQWLAKEKAQQDSYPPSDRFAWFQGGQPEVVANDEEAIEYSNTHATDFQRYSPKEDVQNDIKSSEEMSGTTNEIPSQKKKAEQFSGTDRQVSVPQGLKQVAFESERKSSNPLSDIYFVVIVAGCSAVAIFAVIAAGYCFYRFQKNNKAAAEVDYPAYGVTGPNKEHNTSPSGDRRLAQSAQMYHYQHQKQQMIAVEKATAVRNTSASDVDSEEENEEGDYTVYECPGLAPTGEMEVKNPLFHDDSTPMSPPVTAKETAKN